MTAYTRSPEFMKKFRELLEEFDVTRTGFNEIALKLAETDAAEARMTIDLCDREAKAVAERRAAAVRKLAEAEERIDSYTPATF